MNPLGKANRPNPRKYLKITKSDIDKRIPVMVAAALFGVI